MTRKWCEVSGEFDDRVMAFAGEHATLSTLMIVGVPKRASDPVFHFIGDGLFPWLPRGYRQQAIGGQVETFPDKEFGAWLSGFYRSVALSGEPRCDHVRARVRVADEDGPTYGARYERLLLPWRSACGDTLISLCARRLEDAGPATPAPRH
jgi:hypothetical protein